MPKKKVTLSLDSKTYDEFKKGVIAGKYRRQLWLGDVPGIDKELVMRRVLEEEKYA